MEKKIRVETVYVTVSMATGVNKLILREQIALNTKAQRDA